jgi:hypothetical protein
MIKTRNMLTKVIDAVAVLAMLTATFAVAQEGTQAVGTPIGGVERSVSGIDRSVRADVVGNGAGSSGAKPLPSSAPAAMWVPTRNGGGISLLVPSVSGGSHPGGVQEQPGSEQVASKQEVPKREGAKKEGHQGGSGMRAGKESASSYGGLSASTKPMFGFTGKYQVSKSQEEAKRKRADKLKFAKEMDTKESVTPGRRSRGKHSHGHAPVLKTSEP